LDDHDEAQELFFIGKGTTAIGFELNKKTEYVVIKKDLCLVGAYAVVFDERSQVIYKAITEVSGFSIRK
jgi:hypothetical protein